MRKSPLMHKGLCVVMVGRMKLQCPSKGLLCSGRVASDSKAEGLFTTPARFAYEIQQVENQKMERERAPISFPLDNPD